MQQRTFLFPALAIAVLLANGIGTVRADSFLRWAASPPMGWNSWDCFGCTVTETQVKTVADYMAAKLAAHGWQYVVVDIQWYTSQSSGWAYDPTCKPLIDGYGRLTPDPVKFPSAASGKGFGPLADYIHARGLKFGVHLLRGIPREAVSLNSPIIGTSYHAGEIADTNSVCAWNPDMYGVDMTKQGAQDYYDSVFRLFASWGVDFVKVDDLGRPYRKSEVEAIRKAIDKSGRSMVFSISPGPSPLPEANNVTHNANMWRLTDDFWDSWNLLKKAFDTCDAWTPYRGSGHWPDADMLPLGAVRIGPKMEHHSTNFTPDEQKTLMTLWCVSRSPLILGGYLPWNDSFTESLITNDEVLAVDKFSEQNQQLFRKNGLIAWTAQVPNSHDRYLALFNTQDTSNVISVPLMLLDFKASAKFRDLWAQNDMGTCDRIFSQAIPAHGAALFRVSSPGS